MITVIHTHSLLLHVFDVDENFQKRLEKLETFWYPPLSPFIGIFEHLYSLPRGVALRLFGQEYKLNLFNMKSSSYRILKLNFSSRYLCLNATGYDKNASFPNNFSYKKSSNSRKLGNIFAKNNFNNNNIIIKIIV